MTDLAVDRKEAWRYLRMGNAEPGAELTARFAAIEDEMLAAIRPAAYWQLVRVADGGGETYRVGDLELRSESLRRTLAGCRHAFLFVATLGAGADEVLRKKSILSGADAMIVQAIATALIETYCAQCEREMAQEPAAAGERLRLRFSPGYGDLPLEVQRPLLAALDSSRRAGVVLTDSLLMVPSKSVSAIIGVGN